MTMFAREVYVERRRALRDRIKSGLVLLLGNGYSPINYAGNPYRFRQDSSFLYYFGLDAANLVGLLDLEGGKDYIFGDEYTIDDIIWMGDQPTLLSRAERVGVQCVRPLAELKDELDTAVRHGRKVHYLPPYRAEQTLRLHELLGLTPGGVRHYVSQQLVEAVIAQRSVKSKEEIAELDAIHEAGYKMHLAAMHGAKPGASEQVLTGELEGIAVSYGYMTSFNTILSQHGERLHNEAHDGILEKGRLLLVDCGAESQLHYASDNTRVSPVGGEFSQKQLAVYETVLRGVNKGIELARPGVKYLDVHTAVCRVLTEGLQAIGVMKGNIDESVANGAHALFLPHGLGHMMGLDTHDMEGYGEDNVGYDTEVQRSAQFGTASLRCGKRLQEGFVVTVEPGIYFIPRLIEKWKREKINNAFINFHELEKYTDFGGIRLEDDIVITSTGCRIIGEHRIPIEPKDVCEEVRKGMAGRA
jgi:Xaa-Pro aminopeptidase